ncbi:MAG: nitroreductase [Nocardioides sp.]|uniref:nitroreductase n=1 Tax=Nocardioides sp. TaxID=35761 RepID=UPI003F0D3C66
MSATEIGLSAFTRLAQARHSCRAFLPEPLEADLVTDLLDVAGSSASWCNVQPWQVVVTGPEETEKLRSFLAERIPTSAGGYDITPPASYEGAHAERRRGSGFALYEAVGVARDDKAGRMQQAWRNFTFFDAPHVAVLTADAALGPYALVDCGGWLSTFMLAATSAGVATVAQAAIASQSGLVREFFDLPEDRHVVCAISFGRPDPEHPANQFRTDRVGVETYAGLRGFTS